MKTLAIRVGIWNRPLNFLMKVSYQHGHNENSKFMSNSCDPNSNFLSHQNSNSLPNAQTTNAVTGNGGSFEIHLV